MIEIFTRKFGHDFYDRNKKIVWFSTGFFLAISIGTFIVLSIVMGGGESNSQIPIIFDDSLSAVDYFIHNFSVDLMTIISGLILSIFAILSIGYNAFLLGVSFSLDPIFCIVSILPHGIFEFVSLILSLSGALILTKLEIKLVKAAISKDKTVGEEWNESKIYIKDILLLILVSMVLLIVAAIIESNIPAIVHMFY